MSHAQTEQAAVEPAPLSHLRSRLGTMLALAPLGVWTIIHLWNNLDAHKGAEAWEKSVTSYGNPVAHAVILTVVLLPLVIHTVWGLGRVWMTRPNNGSYGYFSNLKYALQRLSALGLLLFLGAHIWLAMLHPRMEGGPEKFQALADHMRQTPLTVAVYVLGVAGIAYHLGNGLASASMALGFVTKRDSIKRMDWVAYVVFGVLAVAGWSVIYALWKAGVPATLPVAPAAPVAH